jgi:hypothetical protein
MQGISMEGMDIDAGLTMEDLLVQYFANQAREECCCQGGRKFGCKTQKWSYKKCEAAGSSRSRNLGQFPHKRPFPLRKLLQYYFANQAREECCCQVAESSAAKLQKWLYKKCETAGSSRGCHLGQFSHKEPFLSARPVLCQPGKRGVLLPGGPKVRLQNAKMVG